MGIKPDGLHYHISAGGSAIVGDGTCTVTYNMKGATAGYLSSKTPSVFAPITNPLSTSAKLMTVEVECKGSNGGKITELWIYYASNSILNAKVADGSTDFSIAASSTQEIADYEPYGINVTLKLSLPQSNSTVDIYSITLGFDDNDTLSLKCDNINWVLAATKITKDSDN